jgi:hypothetical membrane protein
MLARAAIIENKNGIFFMLLFYLWAKVGYSTHRMKPLINKHIVWAIVPFFMTLSLMSFVEKDEVAANEVVSIKTLLIWMVI